MFLPALCVTATPCVSPLLVLHFVLLYTVRFRLHLLCDSNHPQLLRFKFTPCRSLCAVFASARLVVLHVSLFSFCGTIFNFSVRVLYIDVPLTSILYCTLLCTAVMMLDILRINVTVSCRNDGVPSSLADPPSKPPLCYLNCTFPHSRAHDPLPLPSPRYCTSTAAASLQWCFGMYISVTTPSLIIATSKGRGLTP